MEPSIELIEENGRCTNEYSVDESQLVSNAGDACLYEYTFKGELQIWEIITWNSTAVEHFDGEKEANLLDSFRE